MPKNKKSLTIPLDLLGHRFSKMIYIFDLSRQDKLEPEGLPGRDGFITKLSLGPYKIPRIQKSRDWYPIVVC